MQIETLTQILQQFPEPILQSLYNLLVDMLTAQEGGGEQ